MKRFSLVFVIASLVGASGVAAQDEPRSNGAPVDDGAYVRVGAGATFVSDWEQDYAFNPAFVFVGGPPTGQTVSNGNGFLAGAALGFDYADGIRTELEYRYASSQIANVVIDEFAGPTTVTPANENSTAHFIFSNFFFDFYNQSRMTPFIGGGVGGALVENENGDWDGALAYQARAGVAFAVSNGLSLDLEYIYMRTNKLVYGPKVEDFTPAGPFETNISGDRYEASSVMLSLRKQF